MSEAIPGDARLLTYAELGELLGIEPESAKRRAVRHGWRRVPGNEGRTLVAVPRTALPETPPAPRTPARPEVPESPRVPEDMPKRPGDTERAAVAALGAAFAAARQDAEALRAKLRVAEQGRAEAEGRAAILAERVEAERRDAEAKARELVEARERAARAEGESATRRTALDREQERAGRAEARAEAALAMADRRGREVVELRERVGQAEGESGALRERVAAERERAEASARDLEAARAELADWTAGGPVARAWRAFLNRRGRA
jgi:hypothetical protein